MKPTLFRILLAQMIGSIIGSGCVNENRESHDPVVKLAFDPVMHVQVRSENNSDNPTDNPENPDFGVSAWTLESTLNWNSDAATANPYLEMEPLVRNGILWYPESSTEWPSNRYSLTCIGFAPRSAVSDCNPTDGVLFKAVDTSSDPGDLRYTDPQTELPKKRNGGIIPLPMIPALCEIEFRTRSVAAYGNTPIYVRRIVIENLATRGSFRSRPEPLWSLSNNDGTMLFFEGELQAAPDPQKTGTTRRIIPQTLDASIRVDYEFEAPSGNRLLQTENEIPLKRRLEAGRHYTLTLAVSPSGVELIQETPSQSE